jgi:hypothetical protein
MRPGDVDQCVGIIAGHPVIGPRYGRAIDDLRLAWLRLLDCEAKATVVIEEVEAALPGICFVGVSVFVDDDFILEIKTPPLFWFGPELARRIVRGKSPLLSSKRLREANSRGGLNAVTWEGCIRPGFERHTEVYRNTLNSFIEYHRGYLWKEVIAPQLESAERLRWTIQSGGLLWDPARGCYTEALVKTPRRIIRAPHIVGITREIEKRRPGTWAGALFDYHPPQIGFSRGEQRTAAAGGAAWNDG